jgi:hypothetical protein
MTADLEYFKCDMCGVYMHRDIFCDHRRDCHGRDSTMLKRGECAKLSEALSRETRELLLAKEAGAGGPCSTISSTSHSRRRSPNHATNIGTKEGEGLRAAGDSGSREAQPAGVAEEQCAAAVTPRGRDGASSSCSGVSKGTRAPTKINAVLSTAELERRQEARTRRAVSDRYQAAVDAKISAMLTEKKSALMDFLYS